MASAGSSGQQAANTARRAAESRWIERTARVGLAARGLVYVLIGILALQIAFVDRAEQADQKGAFQTLAQTASARRSCGWSSSALSAMAPGRQPKLDGATVASAATTSAPPGGSSRR
jgi:Domain of Unknown Function (DUF1206)